MYVDFVKNIQNRVLRKTKDRVHRKSVTVYNRLEERVHANIQLKEICVKKIERACQLVTLPEKQTHSRTKSESTTLSRKDQAAATEESQSELEVEPWQQKRAKYQ